MKPVCRPVMAGADTSFSNGFLFSASEDPLHYSVDVNTPRCCFKVLLHPKMKILSLTLLLCHSKPIKALFVFSAKLKADDELIRVMTKAVNELGLEWSLPEEPSCSRLDKWFLPGRHQALCQRSSPFFPEVHNELTKSWRAPYLSHIRPSTSAALNSVDGAEEKGHKHLLPLDESIAAHLCPPRAIGWKARATHSLDTPTQRLDILLQRCFRWLCFRSFKPRCLPTRRLVWILPHSGT